MFSANWWWNPSHPLAPWARVSDSARPCLGGHSIGQTGPDGRRRSTEGQRTERRPPALSPRRLRRASTASAARRAGTNQPADCLNSGEFGRQIAVNVRGTMFGPGISQLGATSLSGAYVRPRQETAVRKFQPHLSLNRPRKICIHHHNLSQLFSRPCRALSQCTLCKQSR